jgi:hypothetical protein
MSRYEPSLKRRLADICSRIDQAARRHGTKPRDVTLVAASKSQPTDRLLAAWHSGQRVFGENRVQEAETKILLLPAAEWHLIGPLQTNKAKRAVQCFDVVHSLDRLKIASVLDRHAEAAGKTLRCFVQVNLADEPTKHGFACEEVSEAVATIASMSNLRVVGLMAIPPPASPEETRPWFRKLRRMRDELAEQAEISAFGSLLSMGMSSDFEVAIEEGATHVRIGSALFGRRPAVVSEPC